MEIYVKEIKIQKETDKYQEQLCVNYIEMLREIEIS
jgi:hypothetical protein